MTALMLHSLTVYPLAASMESLLMSLEQSSVETYLGPITQAAVSLAAACVAISMIGLAAKFLKATQFDWWQFVRPILIFFVVCNFSTIVIGPIRGIAGIYNTRLAEAAGTTTESFKAVFRERAVQMCHEEFGRDGDVFEDDEEGGWLVTTLRKIGNKLTKAYFNINEKANLGIATLVSGILFFLLNMVLSVMIIIAHFYLIIMALIGPYTFAIAILTTYPNGIRLWVERYIQYTIWQPLLYFVMALGTEVMVLGNQGATWGGFWAWCFMIVAIFLAMKQVPAFASFVIESAGTELLANQMSGIGSQLLQKVSSASMLVK